MFPYIHVLPHLLRRPGPPTHGFGEKWKGFEKDLERNREGFGKDLERIRDGCGNNSGRIREGCWKDL
jgi:hypothetical protein